jgi:short-subunit dehydrogenase
MKPTRFDGKVAVITGSSRGIGKAIAMELAQKGAFIVLNGRDKLRLTQTREELLKITTDIITVCCDVSTTEGGQLLIDEAIRAFGKIDILVNNVGVSMRGKMADLNPEVFRTLFESNIYGTVNATIPAIPHLRKTKGSLVFISSLAGIRGLPFLSAYCSSKMALRAMAESLRIEERQHNLHIGLIYVGYTENDPGKESIAANGSKIALETRRGKGVQSKESVAKAVIRNIEKRKFITVLTTIGKLNAFLQARFPALVERIIFKNLKKFEDRSK